MGFSYLNGRNWVDITREERIFCAALYEHMMQEPSRFIRLLNEKTPLQLPKDCEWEVGYEVCFYRDLLKHRGESIRKSPFPQKRTFDLCLFSERHIVIIEAKVQQPFRDKEVKVFLKDKKMVPECTGKADLTTALLALATEEWCKSEREPDKRLREKFDGFLSWNDVFEVYQNSTYTRANGLFGK